MTGPAERAARIRRGAGWFARSDRGLVVVTGADRVRWTNGMLSNDVAALAPDPARSGCRALLLTPEGRIAADLHVLCREDALWLELEHETLGPAVERLDRYLVADDVVLADDSAAWRRFALEGARAPRILADAAGRELAIAPDCCADVELGGMAAVVGAWGFCDEGALQLFVPADAEEAVRAAVFEAAGDDGLELGDPDTLEVLRIEAGVPRFGAELGLDVLPAEADLVGRAVSLSKGCFTGQEIVARMASRDAAAHRLVGIAFETDATGGEPVAPGAAVWVEKARVGELTSVCRSASAGEIGLGYLRRAHVAPGTPLRVGGRRGRVVELPFVRPRA